MKSANGSSYLSIARGRDLAPNCSDAANSEPAWYYSPGFTLRRRATSLGWGEGPGRTAAARYRWRPTSRPGRDLGRGRRPDQASSHQAIYPQGVNTPRRSVRRRATIAVSFWRGWQRAGSARGRNPDCSTGLDSTTGLEGGEGAPLNAHHGRPDASHMKSARVLSRQQLQPVRTPATPSRS
jgi:hypothetical protein